MSNNNETCGIKEILEVILVLQKNAACEDLSLDSCDKMVLGCQASSCICNTRPVILYLCGNTTSPLLMPTTKDNINCSEETAADACSSVFRVEKVEGNSATFRVLETNPDETSIYPYIGTNSFFTVNLDCLCCLRCLNDTCVECV